jgi:hypothetical protein
MSCAVSAAAREEISVALHGGDMAEKHRGPAPVGLHKDQLPQREALAPNAGSGPGACQCIPMSQIRNAYIPFWY